MIISTNLLNEYLQLIIEENKKVNILGTSDPEQIIIKHILDSATAIPSFGKNKTILDIGSGGGFPGIVLSILSQNTLILLESKKKKADFLTQAISSLSLKNITVQNVNINELKKPTDIITSRAFSSISKLIKLTTKCQKKGTRFLLYKGKKEISINELKEAELPYYDILPLIVPFLNAERNLIQFTLKR